MHPFKKVATFTDRFPLIGPIIWTLCVQYYIIQIVVASAWHSHFSLSNNLISDLGNTACGQYSGRLVCSPLHGLMNSSFILLGITMALGSLLIYQEFKETFSSRIGFSGMGVAGIGALLVGLFPENTIGALHYSGALLTFLIGNLAIVLLGLRLELPKTLKMYTVLSGLVALVALVLFTARLYLGLGPGGMERLTAYPQTTWLIVFGLYISRNHFMKRMREHRR